MKRDLNFRPYTKILSKVDHRLKCKYKTLKLLEDNLGRNLKDWGYGKEFLDLRHKESTLQSEKLIRWTAL